MSIAVLCVRRFNIREHGVAKNVQAAKQLELPLPPVVGQRLNLGDEITISVQWVEVSPAGSPELGVVPCAVKVGCQTEPAERLEPALASGWARLGAPEPEAP